MNRVLEKTRLHRLLGAELGEVPRWAVSNANPGLSVLDLLPGAIFAVGAGGGSALALIVGFWALPVVFVVFAVGEFVRREVGACKQVERKCRARRRRAECLACGQPLEHSERAIAVCVGCRRAQRDSSSGVA